MRRGRSPAEHVRQGTRSTPVGARESVHENTHVYENQQLIEALFAELDEHQPEGFTYKVFRLDDRVTSFTS